MTFTDPQFTGLTNVSDGFFNGLAANITGDVITISWQGSYPYYGGGGAQVGAFTAVFDVSSGSSPSLKILSVAQTNGIFNLTWSAVSGSIYQVQYNTNLTTTNWTDLNSLITASNLTASTTDSNPIVPGAQRFYRVMLVPLISSL